MTLQRVFRSEMGLVSPAIFDELAGLTLGDEGQMRVRMETPTNVAYWVCFRKTIVSWGLIFPEIYKSGQYLKNRHIIYFFTHKDYRRQGYATIIASTVKLDYPEIKRIYCRWDEVRNAFFKKAGLKWK